MRLERQRLGREWPRTCAGRVGLFRRQAGGRRASTGLTVLSCSAQIGSKDKATDCCFRGRFRFELRGFPRLLERPDSLYRAQQDGCSAPVGQHGRGGVGLREGVSTSFRFNPVVETGVPGFIPRGS